MIKQGIIDGSILEKKFKILRTSIMLGNIDDREKMMESYEKAAREVDEMKRRNYEELLAGKLYTTKTLPEEEERLRDLISFIEARVQERNNFIDDYIKITSSFLDDLPKVSLEDKLNELRERLNNISEYLGNCREIEKINDELKSLRDELEEKYENKANNEVINSKLEDELIDEFNKAIADKEYYTSLNYQDIETELGKINSQLTDKKDVMDTFISSYDALRSAGISGAEREEYLSYVQDAKNDYYREVEKKYILSIYALVLDKQHDYDLLYEKRVNIDNLLQQRASERKNLNILTTDEFAPFVGICNEQFNIIKSQKYNIENIDKLIIKISDLEEKLEELDKANNRDEIITLLNEFSVDSVEIEKIEMPDEKEVRDEVVGSRITVPKADNVVVRVDEPVKINVKNAVDTAKLVMKKVVIVLEPKKFNNKRNKLEEAEAEIEASKKQEEEKNSIFTELDTDNKTGDVFTDYDDGSAIVTGTNDEFTVPTEIFITEEKKEDIPATDLFSETDPFLDDNELEIEKSKDEEEPVDGMPIIKNIGTVKPNSVLNQIEDAAKANANINLPTMGLTDASSEVPIVSENYIN